MLFVSLFYFPALKKQITNRRGQGMVEYLVIVCFVGIASIGLMRVVGQNIKARFGDISAALGSSTKHVTLESADASALKKNDFTNFMNGAKSSKSGAHPSSGGSEAGADGGSQ